MSRAEPIDNLLATSEPDQRRRRSGPRPLGVREQQQQRLQASQLRAMLAEMEQEAGPIPDDIMAEARRDLRRWSAD